MAKKWINSVPPTAVTTCAFSSVFILLVCYNPISCCSPYVDGPEDVQMAQCLHNSGVDFVDSRDIHGRMRWEQYVVVSRFITSSINTAPCFLFGSGSQLRFKILNCTRHMNWKSWTTSKLGMFQTINYFCENCIECFLLKSWSRSRPKFTALALQDCPTLFLIVKIK